MPHDEGVVQPAVTKRTPQLGPFAIIAATAADLNALKRNCQYPDKRNLYLSQLYYDSDDPKAPALVGPLMGAPYAVMMLETLRAWGVQNIIFLGWCGSISSDLRIGDLLLADSAVVDEGTSLHYKQKTGAVVRSDQRLFAALEAALGENKLQPHKGRVWSTDGIFRETPSKIEKFQQVGALAVEMEVSALYAAAQFHSLGIAALLVVSDELFTLKWRAGFKAEAFKYARHVVCDAIARIYRNQSIINK